MDLRDNKFTENYLQSNDITAGKAPFSYPFDENLDQWISETQYQTLQAMSSEYCPLMEKHMKRLDHLVGCLMEIRLPLFRCFDDMHRALTEYCVGRDLYEKDWAEMKKINALPLMISKWQAHVDENETIASESSPRHGRGKSSLAVAAVMGRGKNSIIYLDPNEKDELFTVLSVNDDDNLMISRPKKGASIGWELSVPSQSDPNSAYYGALSGNDAPECATIKYNMPLNNNKKYYYEVVVNSDWIMQIGVGREDFDRACDASKNIGVGDHISSWAFDGHRMKVFGGEHGNSGEGKAYGSTKWKKGDIIGCAIDMGNHTLQYFHNGEDLGVAANDIPDDLSIAWTLREGQSMTVVFEPDFFKFGARLLSQGFEPLGPIRWNLVGMSVTSKEKEELIVEKLDEYMKLYLHFMVCALPSPLSPSFMHA